MDRKTWPRFEAWLATAIALFMSGFLWVSFTLLGWVGVFGMASASTSSGATAASAASEQAGSIAFGVLEIMLAVGTAWVVYRNRDIPAGEFAPRLTDARRRVVGGGIGGAVVYVGIIVMAIFVQGLFASMTHLEGVPPPAERSVPRADYLIGDGLESVGAGFWEEVCLFAVPIALLAIRRTKVIDGIEASDRSTWTWGPIRWGLILLTVIVLRAGIHLYYGWTMLFVIPWMVGAVLLFRALGSVWPLVIGHATYDLFGDLQNRIPEVYDIIQAVLWVIVAISIGIIAMSIAVQWSAGGSVDRIDRPEQATEPSVINAMSSLQRISLVFPRQQFRFW